MKNWVAEGIASDANDFIAHPYLIFHAASSTTTQKSSLDLEIFIYV